MVLWQGRNMAPLEHLWLTMVRILLYPQLFGRPVIKSITTWVNSGVLSGIVIL